MKRIKKVMTKAKSVSDKRETKWHENCDKTATDNEKATKCNRF